MEIEELKKEIEERNPETYVCEGIADDNQNYWKYLQAKAELKGRQEREKEIIEELKQRVKDRIEDVDRAINNLVDSGNLEAVKELTIKGDMLEWVLGLMEEKN